jgi:lipopolysaccharide transport system permease protein
VYFRNILNGEMEFINNKNEINKISNRPTSVIKYLKRSIGNIGIALSFAKSDIQGRNAQTFLGYFVNLIQILISTLLYWLIFGYILKIDTGSVPFPLFVLTGLIPWVYFSSIIREAGNSLIDNKHLLDKIYFPRVLLPISKVLPGLVDFFIAIFVAIIFMLIFQISLGWHLIFISVFLLVIMLSGFAIGIWIASISVRYRDTSRLIPYLINFGFFITPVFYPATIVPDEISFILFVNPAAFAIEGFRWAMFGTAAPDVLYLLSLIPVFVLLLWGWHNFRKNEKHYADII